MEQGSGLFGGAPPPLPRAHKASLAPLAERMRPRHLGEVVGQSHLLGTDGMLAAILEQGLSQSLILWGPPGSGKTTIAHLVAEASDALFEPFSAVLSGIAEIREVMKRAERERARTGRTTLLFVDEIHRFNRAQQDAFLPFAERGDILLVGATTENPSFELNGALLSRARVLVLEPVGVADVVLVLERALHDPERGLKQRVRAPRLALEEIARAADGDVRRALTVLESAALLAHRTGEITPRVLAQALQRKVVRHDKSGEEHYNTISALHKSVRNSNPDAALYWLARLLEGGEDRDFLARRIVRMAVEDIGLADPAALGHCLAAWDAYRRLGSPEGELALAQAVVLLSQAPKSNAVYRALGEARADVQRTANAPVPLHLCNAPNKLMESLGYAKGYRYAHDDPDAVREMECFPEGLAGRRYLPAAASPAAPTSDPDRAPGSSDPSEGPSAARKSRD